jgi:hypothetical protein
MKKKMNAELIICRASDSDVNGKSCEESKRVPYKQNECLGATHRIASTYLCVYLII